MDGQAGKGLSRAARQGRGRHKDLEVPKAAMFERQAYGHGRRDSMRRLNSESVERESIGRCSVAT